MNIKYILLSAALMLLSCSALFTSCNTDGDDFDYNKHGLAITGTEKTTLKSFVVEDTPASYGVTVQSTQKVESDVNITMAIDTSLVSEYNVKNGTKFYPIPLTSVELDNPNVSISAGSAISSATNVKIVSTEDFVEGRTYLVPVTIKNVQTNGPEKTINKSKTIYLKISRVISFYALENNSQASSNFIFADNQMKALSSFTIEFKFYAYGLGTGTASDNQIQRVLSVEGKDESNASMFRFAESGLQRNQLQWILPGGRAATTTLFSSNRWYTISCTYDGSTFLMYVDGVKDTETSSTSPKIINFQRFELGMSYQGYNSGQFFNGRLAEIRVWNRALGASEVAGGLCGVDPKSSGLVAYWKMNQASGTTILDATGNGYDMDWTKSQRAVSSDNLSATPGAANYLKWLKDDKNKCAQ